ncbi:adenosine deaminase domain-containing protein 1 [Brachionichthys hirsutus]|uniref:adenosine deaminase domain-containing protein 1 n=1 Tax=Brachionichthys hirsutus TaxID=412623 RepID=UPI0036050F53
MSHQGRAFQGPRGFRSTDFHDRPPPPCHFPDRNGPNWQRKGPTVLLEKQIEEYKQGELNAVSLIHLLAQNMQFHLEIKETVTTENVVGLYFAYCVVIDGVAHKTGMGTSKKRARLRASELALRELLPKLESTTSSFHDAFDAPPTLLVKEQPSVSNVFPARAISERKDAFNSQIPNSVRKQLTELMNSYPEFSNCAGTIAAFVMQTSGGYEVVALGTGNFSTKESVSSNGRIVHDSHAIVTARRSLMRFLYRQLLTFFSKTASLRETSILECNDGGSVFSLKSGITFHLYMNQLPKGAAQLPSMMRLSPFSISSWQANNEISLHLSVEGKVFSVLSDSDPSATKIVSMAATDKLTQWQVLGYQGALLSHFMEPIYVDSILIGDSGSTNLRGLEISVSQRVEGITSQLPTHYCLMRPQISRVPPVAGHSMSSDGVTYGVNWTQGDSSLEVVDGLEGKTTQESPFHSGPTLASRLCKAAMLHRFKLLASSTQRPDLLAASSYGDAKRMARPYQEAKSMLKAYLLAQGFGSWLVKPSAVDNFAL